MLAVNGCMGACQLLSHVQLFATPWTVAHQAPLSMGFLRQEPWSGLPCPPLGVEPMSFIPHLLWAFQVALLVKNPPANTGDTASIPDL